MPDFAGEFSDVVIIAFAICSTVIDLYFAGVTNENAGSTFSSSHGVCCDPMIIGSQHTPWLLEKVLPAFSFVTPAKYKSITVEQIAKAMITTSLNSPAKSDVYHYPEMMALNR